MLRNEFIPLVLLAELLGLASNRLDSPYPEVLLAVVIAVRQAKLGLLIDDLVDIQNLVIKSLPGPMRGCGLVTGIEVTGDQTLVSVLQATVSWTWRVVTGVRRSPVSQAGREVERR